MNNPENTISKISEEVLTAMPHVLMVMHLRSTEFTWRRLGQVERGADLLAHQLSVNEIMKEMMLKDIAQIRTDYESRRHYVDPASDLFQEAMLALQVIQDYETRASLVIENRQDAIRHALSEMQSHQTT